MSALAGRARSLCVFIVPLLLLGAEKPSSQKSPPNWFWGCWVVTKDLPTPGVSRLSEKQVNALIGTRIVFTPTCARSGRTIVRTPTYSAKVLSSHEFFELGYISLGQIGIRGDQATEVSLLKRDQSYWNLLGDDVYLRSTDIVIEFGGDYFVAERAKPGDPACRCDTPKTKRKQ